MCQDIVGVLQGFERILANGGSGKDMNCYHARNLCSSSAFVRAVCAVTCGCGDPLSNLFLSGIDEGCPVCNNTEIYRNSISQAPCTDLAPSSPKWQPWADQLAESAPRALQGVI